MHSNSVVKQAATNAADISDPHGVWRTTLTAPRNAANAVRPSRIGNALSSPRTPAVITPASSPVPQAHTNRDNSTPRATITHKAPDFRRTVVFSVVVILKTSPDTRLCQRMPGERSLCLFA